MKPRLLDLFCGAGGAAMGYHRAGFEVVGVDIAPQPNYPFEFHRCDALGLLDALIMRPVNAFVGKPDVIHASPPCQVFTTLNRMPGYPEHPDLLTPTRLLLQEWGGLYVIENVEGAPMPSAARVCGSAFDLDVRRHRQFESNILLLSTPCQHWKQTPRFQNTGTRRRALLSSVVGVYGGSHFKGDNLAYRSKAMGIDWMQMDELSQAIPPAFTEFIGQQLLAALAERPALVGASAGASDGALLHGGAPSSVTTLDATTDTDSAGADAELLRQGSRSAPAEPSKHSPDCDRCGEPAVMWSGAFGDPWVGWCSNVCKNAWLNGDKGVHRRTEGA